MSASNPSSQPKVKIEGGSKPKKHVTIKPEPQTINKVRTSSIVPNSSNNSGKIPITPNEKILKQPNLKSIDNLNISKFYIQPQNENDETPTRSSSSKKLQEQKKIDNKTPSHPPKLKRSVDQSDNQQLGVSTFQVAKKPKSSVIQRPTLFKPVEESIIKNNEQDGLRLKEIFQNIEDEAMKQKYVDCCSKDFQDWSMHGINLINSQYEIVKKIIISRNKLNLKFELIFRLVNKYGDSLENEDQVLKEKMNKLQNLGQEIKNFIK